MHRNVVICTNWQPWIPRKTVSVLCTGIFCLSKFHNRGNHLTKPISQCFNRASHLHLLSHSFSTTLLTVMRWQCCLSKVTVILSHSRPTAVAFASIFALDLFSEDDTAMVTNNKHEGETHDTCRNISVST